MKQIAGKQYAKIRPFLPVQRGNVRIPNIIFINAVLYVLENGCKWRALPERFGKWHSVYARFRRWSRSGVLDRLFAALRELHAPGGDANCFGFDSTSVKVHPDGAGARKTNGLQSIGKSRGGWSTKIHMVSASDRHAMIFRLSGGRPTTRPKATSRWKAVPSRAISSRRTGRHPCLFSSFYDRHGDIGSREPESNWHQRMTIPSSHDRSISRRFG